MSSPTNLYINEQIRQKYKYIIDRLTVQSKNGKIVFDEYYRIIKSHTEFDTSNTSNPSNTLDPSSLESQEKMSQKSTSNTKRVMYKFVSDK